MSRLTFRQFRGRAAQQGGRGTCLRVLLNSVYLRIHALLFAILKPFGATVLDLQRYINQNHFVTMYQLQLKQNHDDYNHVDLTRGARGLIDFGLSVLENSFSNSAFALDGKINFKGIIIL